MSIIKCENGNCGYSKGRLHLIKDCSKQQFDKWREGRILEFSILRDMSSMQLVGFIEFAIVIHIIKSFHQYVLKRIYRELQEHLVFTPNENQSEVIFAVFFCANIPTVDSILTRIKSYDGVDHVGLFITTKWSITMNG